MKPRSKGSTRNRVEFYLPPDLLYLIEQDAIQKGYIRTGRTTLGKPDIGWYLEALLSSTFRIEMYTPEQRQAMAHYHISQKKTPTTE